MGVFNFFKNLFSDNTEKKSDVKKPENKAVAEFKPIVETVVASVEKKTKTTKKTSAKPKTAAKTPAKVSTKATKKVK